MVISSLRSFLQERLLLPLLATQEWGEDRGEGRLLAPPLSSIAWRRGNVRLRLRRATLHRGFPIRSRRALQTSVASPPLCRLDIGETAGWKPAPRPRRQRVSQRRA